MPSKEFDKAAGVKPEEPEAEGHTDEKMKAVREFARLTNLKLELEEKVAGVKRQLADLHDGALSYFMTENVQRVNVEGRTLYLQRELWAKRAKGVDAETACEGVKGTDWAWLVKEGINSQKISAEFREREKGGEEPVPEELQEWFSAEERYKVGTRAS